MKQLYFDHAASTPLDPRVKDAMEVYLAQEFGNASSQHRLGQSAAHALDAARGQVSEMIACRFSEVIFTSGATESNNLLIQGRARWFRQTYPGKKGHLICSAIEHPSVLEVMSYLQKYEGFEVSILPVDENGVVKISLLKDLIKETTCLVSVMSVNNEVGTIQPIQEMGKLIKELNNGREIPVLFHTDASQSFFYEQPLVKEVGIHALTFSGHKLYGPKGVGVLYLDESFIIRPLMLGGSQEWGLRSGTYHTAALAGLACALQLLTLPEHKKDLERMKELQTVLKTSLAKAVAGIRFNGKPTVAGHVHVTLPVVSGENVFLSLDMQGVCVSLGSACAAGKVKDSVVLQAMGMSVEEIRRSLRFTLGKDTTKEEILEICKILGNVVASFI